MGSHVPEQPQRRCWPILVRSSTETGDDTSATRCGSIGEIIDLILSFVRDDTTAVQQTTFAHASAVDRRWRSFAETYRYREALVTADSRHYLYRTLRARPELGHRIGKLRDCTPALGASAGVDFGLPLLPDLFPLLPNLTSLSCSGSYGEKAASSVLSVLQSVTTLTDVTVIDAIDRDVYFLGTLPHLCKLTLPNFRDLMPQRWTDELPEGKIGSVAPLQELEVHLAEVEHSNGAMNSIGWLAEHTSDTLKALTLRQVSATMASNVFLNPLRRLRKLDFERSERWPPSGGPAARAGGNDGASDTALDAFLGHLGRTTPVATLDYHLCPEVDVRAQLVAIGDRFGDLANVEQLEVHSSAASMASGPKIAERRLVHECYARLAAEHDGMEPDPEGCVARLWCLESARLALVDAGEAEACLETEWEVGLLHLVCLL
jgi:hypothetical protein